jgi:hypothetical protein
LYTKLSYEGYDYRKVCQSVSSINQYTSANLNSITSQSTSSASHSTSVETVVSKKVQGHPSMTIEQKAANKRKRDEEMQHNLYKYD